MAWREGKWSFIWNLADQRIFMQGGRKEMISNASYQDRSNFAVSISNGVNFMTIGREITSINFCKSLAATIRLGKYVYCLLYTSDAADE